MIHLGFIPTPSRTPHKKVWGFIPAAQGAVEDTTLTELANKFNIGVLGPLISVLFVLATVIFIWGVIQYVIAQSGDVKKIDDAKRVITWGIIGMFLMASAWGIIAALCNFFGTCIGIAFPG